MPTKKAGFTPLFYDNEDYHVSVSEMGMVGCRSIWRQPPRFSHADCLREVAAMPTVLALNAAASGGISSLLRHWHTGSYRLASYSGV